MAYHRSPTCSYCHTRGHNRRACPTMQSRALEAAAKPVGDRSWQEQRALERVEQYKQVTTSRSCSYCSEPGHNAKGCATRKNDIINATNELISYRKKFLASIKKHGIGVGAILAYTGYYGGYGYAGRDEKTPAHYLLVRGFEDSYITHWNYNVAERSTSIISCKHVSDLDNSVSRYNNGIAPPISVLADIFNNPSLESYSAKVSVESTSPIVGFDENNFVDYDVCKAIVIDRFQLKRRNKLPCRSDLVYDKVIPAN